MASTEQIKQLALALISAYSALVEMLKESDAIDTEQLTVVINGLSERLASVERTKDAAHFLKAIAIAVEAGPADFNAVSRILH